MKNTKTGLLRAGLLSFTILVPATSHALTITSETDGDVLADALFLNLPGLKVTSTELIGFEGQSGIYNNVIGTYGLPQDGIVFSSGNVLDYQAGGNSDTGTTTSYGNADEGGFGDGFCDEVPEACEDGVPVNLAAVVNDEPGIGTLAEIITPNTNAATPSQEALLQPITGEDQHFDVVQLNIEFETAANVSSVTFFGAFGSEEWPEYVDSDVTDGFGLYVNGVNQAGVSEFNGGTPLPVNIDHPSMAAITGTELDGVLAPGSNPVLRFDVDVDPGATNNFTIILADAGDSVLDTTVYISSFIAANPGGGGGEPVPATGQTEFDPLLPITTEDGTPVFDENGGFTIDIAQEIAEQGQLIWVDPVVAVGYTYEVSGGALITHVTAPSLATIADLDGYTISDGITTVSLMASQSVSIFDVFGVSGVSTLILSGIDTSLNVDPTDPLGFPLGLNFANVTADFQVTVTPDTFDTDAGGPTPVPLPATGLLLGAALFGAGALRRRQSQA